MHMAAARRAPRPIVRNGTGSSREPAPIHPLNYAGHSSFLFAHHVDADTSTGQNFTQTQLKRNSSLVHLCRFDSMGDFIFPLPFKHILSLFLPNPRLYILRFLYLMISNPFSCHSAYTMFMIKDPSFLSTSSCSFRILGRYRLPIPKLSIRPTCCHILLYSSCRLIP